MLSNFCRKSQRSISPSFALIASSFGRSSANAALSDVSESSVPPKGKCGKVCYQVASKKHCKEVCATSDDADRPLAKVFVGVVLPREAPTGINNFQFCQGDKCVEGDPLEV